MKCKVPEYHSLREQIARIPVIDTHEHLPNEDERLRQHVDFFTLFSHYAVDDMVAAGATPDEVEKLNSDLSVEEKWKIFEPYYRHTMDGSYARCAHLAMKKFYDMDCLTSLKDAEVLSEKVRSANEPGLYRRVLKEACNIVTGINHCGMTVDREFFTPVRFVTEFARVSSMDIVCFVEKETGRSATSLERYVQALSDILAADKKKGLKGIKFSFAYHRKLDFESTSAADAERIFSRISDETIWRPSTLGYEKTKPLQDYLTHRLIEIAGDLDLTVVFHTGIQAMNNNNLENCRPGPLWNVLNRFRNVRFDIFHIGLPWYAEAGMLAKYFSHVYVNFAWAHMISPEISVRALKTYVDMVPRNKVLGFGGDYAIVEPVYGHLEVARDDIARSLAEMMEDGVLDEDRAISWAKAILHDNPIKLYKLDIECLD